MPKYRSQRNVVELMAFLVCLFWCVPVCCPSIIGQEIDESSLDFEQSYQQTIIPMLSTYCGDCHSGVDAEAEWDLSEFSDLESVRSDLPRWVRVAELIRSRQMPPVDADQPSDSELGSLNQWLDKFLLSEAAKFAGDPGPVPLRRLSNAEYTYAVQDLTGVSELRPAEQFPEDAAVGEGFTNTGSGQGMSPAVAQKYLDSAKKIAQHMVLLPDGIGFSPSTSRNDRTNRLLADIQKFYDRYTLRDGGTVVDLQSVVFETNSGGRIPLQRYLRVLRDGKLAVLANAKLPDGINRKYLDHLQSALTSSDPLLADLGRRLVQADDLELDNLVTEIQTAQKSLWRFHPVGQLGREGSANSWMELNLPIVTQQRLTKSLAPSAQNDHVNLVLSSSTWNDRVNVRWQNIQLRFKDNPFGPLAVDARKIAAINKRVSLLKKHMQEHASDYVVAIRRLVGSNREDKTLSVDALSSQLTEELSLQPELLKRWLRLLEINVSPNPVQHAYTNRTEAVEGHHSIRGWTADAIPNMLVNSSDQPISFSTLTVPGHGVTVHPSPTQQCVIAWKCVKAGAYLPGLKVFDQDANCGNGFRWQIELLRASEVRKLGDGVVDNGQAAEWIPGENLSLEPGDFIRLLIGPRDGDYVCDTTGVDFWLDDVSNSEAAKQRKWRLADDLIRFEGADGNLVPDQFGNQEVWHLGYRESLVLDQRQYPNSSLLGRWRVSLLNEKVNSSLDSEVIDWIGDRAASVVGGEDLWTRQWIDHVRGPLDWLQLANDLERASEEANQTASDDVGSTSLEFQVPADWLTDPQVVLGVASPEAPVVTFEATATIQDAGGAAQVWITSDQDPKEASGLVDWSRPFLVSADSEGPLDFVDGLRRYASLFPAALCYRKIVPVDEVVTLTLFHREDEHLQRLFLDEEEVAELDQLWNELLFVSQEPLQLVVALEQLIEFATQDRQDLVNPLQSLRPEVKSRADAFVLTQFEAEPIQLNRVIDLANIAWRRQLEAAEKDELRQLYSAMRAAELGHEPALQLLLARILTSPQFLFKLESEQVGRRSHLISNHELATRLSFFLGSTTPDIALLEDAANEELTVDGQLNEVVLEKHVERLLSGVAARRMATEFACQWLHIRGFDQHNEKNENLFPEFVDLRADMNEEAIRFFEFILREDRSILEIVESDWMVLNAALAQHYELADAFNASEEWLDESWKIVRRIPLEKRGGVLAMASVLASQSGASRTSPILRGNWVYETLLGQKLPKPPAGVPILPEEVPAGLSARQLIEMHSSQPGCANCHIRIDPFGFAMEQFDVLGRIRTVSDTTTTVEDGSQIDGLLGLKEYLLRKRKDDFVQQFCRKLLGFALGRPLQLSDELLLREMKTALEADEYRIQTAIKVIVQSPQFTKKRGQGMTSPLDM